MRATLAFVLLAGCGPVGFEPDPPPGHAGRPDVPRLLGPSEVTIRGSLSVGAAVRDTFSARDGLAIGFVTELSEGSAVVAELDADPPAELFSYGPLSDEGWFAAPVLGRDGGSGALPLVASRTGLYLVAALGPGDAAPFALWLRPE